MDKIKEVYERFKHLDGLLNDPNGMKIISGHIALSTTFGRQSMPLRSHAGGCGMMMGFGTPIVISRFPSRPEI